MWLSIWYNISVKFVQEKKACKIFFSNSSGQHTPRKNSRRWESNTRISISKTHGKMPAGLNNFRKSATVGFPNSRPAVCVHTQFTLPAVSLKTELASSM
jgi:hypothetical protein